MDEKVRRGLFSIAKDKLLNPNNETLLNLLNEQGTNEKDLFNEYKIMVFHCGSCFLHCCWRKRQWHEEVKNDHGRKWI